VVWWGGVGGWEAIGFLRGSVVGEGVKSGGGGWRVGGGVSNDE